MARLLALDPQGAGMAVKDLDMETDAERVELAEMLWSVGAIRTVSGRTA